MNDLTKDEILDKYHIRRAAGEFSDHYELVFKEGGRETPVSVYLTEQGVLDFSEEDALAHWMNVLKRGVADA